MICCLELLTFHITLIYYLLHLNVAIQKILFVTGHQPGVDDDDSQDAGSSRAQYVSANCVVFTHYQGDASTVVDEHFSRALDKTSHAKGN